MIGTGRSSDGYADTVKCEEPSHVLACACSVPFPIQLGRPQRLRGYVTYVCDDPNPPVPRGHVTHAHAPENAWSPVSSTTHS